MNPITLAKTAWFVASQVCVSAVVLYIVQYHGIVAPVCTTQVTTYVDSVEEGAIKSKK